MAVPFGPHRSLPIVSSVNPDPTPLRKRKEYKDLAIELGEAMARLSKISGDYTTRYQEEMEACENMSFLAFKLARFIEKHAWGKPGE